MLNRMFLFWWTLLSHYRRHPAQGVFLLLGLSLGVAMLLATLMVSSAAKLAFSQAQQTLGGQAVAHILPAHGENTLPEQLYRDLRLNGISHILPIVEGRVETKQGYVSLRGVDIFPLMNRTIEEDGSGNIESVRLQLNQNQQSEGSESDAGLMQFSFPPYVFLTSSSYARLQGLKDGQRIILEDGRELSRLQVLEDSAGLGYYLLCDIRCVQNILGLNERLSSIVINKLPLELVNKVEMILGESGRLVMADKNVKNPAFTEAFLLNLKGIGFLAFLVGCFIAFNAVRFSVLQRMLTVRQMRLCGATANDIAIALLLELITWAVLASFVGCILAWALASTLLPGIGMTLDQLFFNDNILLLGTIHQWWSWTLLISLTATIIATAFPLMKLARLQPLSDKKTKEINSSYSWLSLPLLAVGCFLAFGPTNIPKSQWLGLFIAVCWFLGGALMVPGVLGWFYKIASQLNYLRQYPTLHWLFSDGKSDQQRQGIAMMVFAIALAASIAVVTMVSSFRQAFSDYLDTTLPESIYLSVDDKQFDKIRAFLSAHENVSHHYPFYMNMASIAEEAGVVRGMTASSLRQASVLFEQYEGDKLASLWNDFHERKGIFVNQAFALSHRSQVGDTVSIVVNKNEIEVEILGIYFSYGSLVNAFIIDQDWLLSLWPQLHTNRIGVFAKDSSGVESLLSELSDNFQLNTHHYVLPQELKKLALSIFQQTFMATQLLSLVIMLIAALGIFCACYTAQLDKQAQLSLVRILGVSGRKMTTLSLLQILTNAFVTCTIALPLGLLISWASIHVVLRYSFGWYFDLSINITELLQITMLSLVVICSGAAVPLYISGKRTTIKCLSIAE